MRRLAPLLLRFVIGDIADGGRLDFASRGTLRTSLVAAPGDSTGVRRR